mmetsp:Transcript_105580/g.340485  ORF Transcript_105580/g.340485 Transcript_105580/m.340485 type:complete len:237 (-) Transcript_105580:20-730(-)
MHLVVPHDVLQDVETPGLEARKGVRQRIQLPLLRVQPIVHDEVEAGLVVLAAELPHCPRHLERRGGVRQGRDDALLVLEHGILLDVDAVDVRVGEVLPPGVQRGVLLVRPLPHVVHGRGGAFDLRAQADLQDLQGQVLLVAQEHLVEVPVAVHDLVRQVLRQHVLDLHHLLGRGRRGAHRGVAHRRQGPRGLDKRGRAVRDEEAARREQQLREARGADAHGSHAAPALTACVDLQC